MIMVFEEVGTTIEQVVNEKISFADIFQIIASIAAAIAAIASCIAIYMTYKTTHPNIKILTNTKGKDISSYHRLVNKSFAIIDLKLLNRSSVAGMIEDIYITYKGKKFYCEDRHASYNISDIGLTGVLANGLRTTKLENAHIKPPITIPPYSVIPGFIVIPNIDDIVSSANERIRIVVHVLIVNSRRERHKSRTLICAMEFISNKIDKNHNFIGNKSDGDNTAENNK